MGWFNEDVDPELRHEGHAVALVQEDGWRWRELGVDDRGHHDITWMQVACTCGWRSPRMLAPVGTTWWRSIDLPAFLDDPYHWEDIAETFWAEHMAGDLIPSMLGRSLSR